MNRVFISLLKGATKNKISLLKMEFSRDELIEIMNSGELKRIYNLSKGSDFSRLPEIEEYISKGSIQPVDITDSKYPSSLKCIFNPPFLLYVRG